MATAQGITLFFKTLASLGVRPMDGADIPSAVAAWQWALQDVGDHELVAAAAQYATHRAEDGKSHRFWPTPADIRAVLGRGDLVEAATGEPSDRVATADAAWGLMHVARARHGREAPPQIGDTPPCDVVFERQLDGRVRRVLVPGTKHGWRLHANPRQCAAMEYGLAAVGGWGAFCGQQIEDISMPAAFRRAYQAFLAERAEDRRVEGVLALAEHTDARGPLALPERPLLAPKTRGSSTTTPSRPALVRTASQANGGASGGRT